MTKRRIGPKFVWASALLLTAAAYCQSDNSQTKPKEKNKIDINGKVTNSVTGEALKKASVVLASRSIHGYAATVETDLEGRFKLSGVPQGNYLLSALKEGFETSYYGGHPGYPVGTPFDVASDKNLESADLKLVPDSVIVGHVRDQDGDPISRVLVLPLRGIYQRGRMQFLPMGRPTQTSDEGEFRLYALKAGSYVIAASNALNSVANNVAATNSPSADQPQLTYKTTYFPSVTDVSASSPVEVAAGSETRGIDIKMVKVPAYRVSGAATGLSANKSMFAMLTQGGVGLMSFITGTRTLIHPDGTFEINGVTPGSYNLITTVDFMSPSGASVPVEVSDHSVEGITTRAEGGLDIPGMLVIEQIAGKQKIEPETVHIALEPLDFLAIKGLKSSVGKDGNFLLEGLIPGRYLVHATNTADLVYIKSIKLGEQELKDNEINLSNGAAPLQIVLSQQPAQVEGTVTAQDGSPMAGATIALIPASKRVSLYMNERTAEDGSFHFTGVTPGSYKLIAWEDVETGAEQDFEWMAKFDSKAVNVVLAPDDQKTTIVKAIRLNPNER